VIGTAITYTVIRSMEALGPAKSGMIIVVSQVAVAYLIELFGLFGVEKVDFEMRKLIGLLLAIGGIILFKYE
ncbi:MAG: DMT family transporter, partial [Lachnospiraceae bacterium]|nr:DMT family transporter [Lachnospiraceae bacterium]